MHNNNTVVTLYALNGSKRTPLREYDHSRSNMLSKARVTIPFGSEYAVGFKFQSAGRRRLELWIDGTMVSDQLILEGEAILERFLDSDKRFKFVEATHEAVADPTNPSNGGIEIKLWEETPTSWIVNPPLQQTQWVWPNWTDRGPGMPYFPYGTTTYSSSETTIDCSNAGDGLRGMVTAGATIEGSKSNQKFDSTFWRGDATSAPLVFKFQLEGQAKPDTASRFCPGCGVKRQKPYTKFCPHCGAKQ